MAVDFRPVRLAALETDGPGETGEALDRTVVDDPDADQQLLHGYPLTLSMRPLSGHTGSLPQGRDRLTAADLPRRTTSFSEPQRFPMAAICCSTGLSASDAASKASKKSDVRHFVSVACGPQVMRLVLPGHRCGLSSSMA